MQLQTKRRLDAVLSRWLIGLHSVLARGLGAVLRRNHTLEPAPRHILFIKILGLGSVFMAADGIAALRRQYPHTRFILLCGSGLKAGLAPTGLFDEIWVINDRNLFRLLVSSLAILRRCWARRGLWVADLEVYSKLTPLFALWTLARNRFGFVLDVVQFRRNLNTHSVYFNRFSAIRQNYLRLAQVMGTSEPVSFHFPQKPLPRPVHTHSYTHIAVNNTCSDLSPERKLPPAQFEALLHTLLAQQPLSLALVGAPGDFAAYQAFLDAHFPGEPRIENRAGQLSFEAYYDFLYHQCAGMVSIDSAPLHIGRSLGLPVLSFWGPTNPRNYLDARTEAPDMAVYLQVPCSPCVHFTEELPCGGDNFCMKDMDNALISTQVSDFVKTLPLHPVS
ncbi:MAG: hypothetical protein KF690_00895 [Bacteroidetes bacterium]|nr:hypothetical protein [Bacteroidota bacterium]